VLVNIIYKIAPEKLWRDAERTGTFTGAPVDVADGFIHFSTADQVQETARKHFHGQTDLILAAIDSTALSDAVRWEPSRGGALFPHLYGPMPMEAVRWTKPLACDAGGSPVIPDLTGAPD
jgi:uncharacterized protein (DUF952 family)